MLIIFDIMNLDISISIIMLIMILHYVLIEMWQMDSCYSSLSLPFGKNFSSKKSLANKDCRKFGGKTFGALKFICIGNVMEIVKIGKKLGELL